MRNLLERRAAPQKAAPHQSPHTPSPPASCQTPPRAVSSWSWNISRQRHHTRAAQYPTRFVASSVPRPPHPSNPTRTCRVRRRPPHPRRRYKHHPSHRRRPTNKLPPPHALTRHLTPPEQFTPHSLYHTHRTPRNPRSRANAFYSFVWRASRISTTRNVLANETEQRKGRALAGSGGRLW